MKFYLLLFVTLMTSLLNDVTFCTMLKNLNCSLYDAEFSSITYNKRLALDVVTSRTNINLRSCLTGCTTHPTCKSVNYNRPQKICEMLGVSLNWEEGIDVHRNNLTEAINWNHFDTRNRNTVKYSLLFLLIT